MRIRARAFILIPNLLAMNPALDQVAALRSTPLIGTWEAVTFSRWTGVDDLI